MWDGVRFGFDYVNLRKLLNGCNGVSENTGWCEDADTDYVPGYVWKWEFWFDALVFMEFDDDKWTVLIMNLDTNGQGAGSVAFKYL